MSKPDCIDSKPSPTHNRGIIYQWLEGSWCVYKNGKHTLPNCHPSWLEGSVHVFKCQVKSRVRFLIGAIFSDDEFVPGTVAVIDRFSCFCRFNMTN